MNRRRSSRELHYQYNKGHNESHGCALESEPRVVYRYHSLPGVPAPMRSPRTAYSAAATAHRGRHLHVLRLLSTRTPTPPRSRLACYHFATARAASHPARHGSYASSAIARKARTRRAPDDRKHLARRAHLSTLHTPRIVITAVRYVHAVQPGAVGVPTDAGSATPDGNEAPGQPGRPQGGRG